jgi:hypothetical protein
MESRRVQPLIRLVSSVAIKWLIRSAAILVLAGAAVELIRFTTGHDSLYGLTRLLSLGQEANIPTFFSALLLLIAASLLTIISAAKRQSGAPFAKHWVILAAGFFYLALDESAQIHELLIRPMRDLLGRYSEGIFYFAWVVPGIGIVAILAFTFFKFWRSLDRATMIYFAAGGLLYIGGTVGVEMVDGLVAAQYGKENLLYNMLIVVEEGVEMSGVIVFVAGLLHHLRAHAPMAHLEVS